MADDMDMAYEPNDAEDGADDLLNQIVGEMGMSMNTGSVGCGLAAQPMMGSSMQE